MCGIVGLVSPQIDQEELEAAARCLVHRGPDDAGIYVGEGVALAARRLSIIDLAGGSQPLSNEDGTVWIAYNGEVVNAPDLRRELENAGHRFRSRSDTEVIVHAYEEWDTAAFTRLRGMFAFALWDGRRRQLLLVRDRFGVKPLYYARDGRRLAFASEIRPLFGLVPSLARRANREAIAQVLGQGYISTPATAFEGVTKLPAAHMLVWAQGQMTVRPYWQLHYPRPGDYLDLSRDEAAEQFMFHLRQAVAAWRLSDVPVGSLLSGGVDSSALAALLTELTGPIHTFHVRFAAASHDESAYAQQVADHIGSHHHELSFSEADFDLLPNAIRHLEEPQASATSVPLFKLYRACHQAGFKVILTGEGADELLGGYHWFEGDRRIRPWLWLPRLLRRPLSRLQRQASAAGRRVLADGGQDPVQRFLLWQQVAAPPLIESLLAGPGRSTAALPLPAHLHGRHPLHQLLTLEAQTRMVDFINFEVDRMSMASSVEARPPFLDHELWQFVCRLPPHLLLDGQMNKRPLRLGAKELLPPAVTRRPKQGLASPHAQWWRRPRLPAWAEEALHPASLAETGIFKPEPVGQLRAAHQQGAADHSRLLMAVFTTQIWHQEMDVGV